MNKGDKIFPSAIEILGTEVSRAPNSPQQQMKFLIFF